MARNSNRGVACVHFYSTKSRINQLVGMRMRRDGGEPPGLSRWLSGAQTHGTNNVWIADPAGIVADPRWINLHRTMKTPIRFGRLGDLLFATGQHGWWRVAASAHLRFLHLFGHACSCHNPEKRFCSATALMGNDAPTSMGFTAGVNSRPACLQFFGLSAPWLWLTSSDKVPSTTANGSTKSSRCGMLPPYVLAGAGPKNQSAEVPVSARFDSNPSGPACPLSQAADNRGEKHGCKSGPDKCPCRNLKPGQNGGERISRWAGGPGDSARFPETKQRQRPRSASRDPERGPRHHPGHVRPCESHGWRIASPRHQSVSCKHQGQEAQGVDSQRRRQPSALRDFINFTHS